MLRIAICDDCEEFTNELSQLVDKWKSRPGSLQCHRFDNGDDLINAHKKAPYDIIFLDIIMPMLNGIDTAAEIRQQDRNVKIIFLTSSPEFAVDSYSVRANNYLLKPLNEERFYRCLDELWEECFKTSNTLLARGLYAVHKIPLSNIEYIEAQNKHMLIYLQDGSVVETTDPMHIYSEKLTLDDGFFRCHRSYIVNMNHISTYTTSEIQMCSGSCIPISRSSHKEFRAAYFALIFGEAGEDKC